MQKENTINPTELELDENSKIILKYIQKYLDKNENCYDKLLELTTHPQLENEFSDLQWTMIIEQAWVLSYKKAMEDNVLTLEEKQELNKIYQLGMLYRNNPNNRVALNYRILTGFRHIVEVDKKDEKIWLPKPTPWDDWNKK